MQRRLSCVELETSIYTQFQNLLSNYSEVCVTLDGGAFIAFCKLGFVIGQDS